MRYFLFIILFASISNSALGKPKKLKCSSQVKHHLTVPGKEAKVSFDLSAVKARVSEVAALGILEHPVDWKSTTIERLPHSRLYRISYNNSSTETLSVVADKHGTVEEYRFQDGQNTEFWCRDEKRARH